MSTSWEDAFDSHVSEEAKKQGYEKPKSLFLPDKWNLERLVSPSSPEKYLEQKETVGTGLKKFTQGLSSPLDIVRLFQKGTMPNLPEELSVPGSEAVGKGFEKAAGMEFPEPESLGGKIAGNALEFLGSLMSTGGLIGRAGKIGKIPLTPGVRNAMAIFTPAATSAIAEKAELPSWMQGAATIGTSLLMHRLTGSSLKDMERGLYSKAEQLSQGKTVDVRSLADEFKEESAKLGKGLSLGKEKKVANIVGEIEKKLAPNVVELDELTAMRRSLLDEKYSKETKEFKGVEKLINKYTSMIDNFLGKYGKQNPEWYDTWRQANSLYKGQKDALGMVNFIKGLKKGATATTAGLSGVLAHSLGIPLKAAITGPAAKALPIVQTGFFVKALAKHPGYRKAYFNVLKNAAKEDTRATLAALKKFEVETEKAKSLEEKENPSWDEAFDSLSGS